jgi:hypothetical protein
MKLRALRSFWLATAKRSVGAGEVFDVPDVYDALELADGINGELVDDRDRARFTRKDRGAWFSAGGAERLRLEPDPKFIEVAKAEMQQPATRSGFVKGWRGDGPRRFFGLI